MDDATKTKLKKVVANHLYHVAKNGKLSYSKRVEHIEHVLEIWSNIEMKDFLQTLQTILYHNVDEECQE